jgi:hypothetical protein
MRSLKSTARTVQNAHPLLRLFPAGVFLFAAGIAVLMLVFSSRIRT